jgi:hypothetical protein
MALKSSCMAKVSGCFLNFFIAVAFDIEGGNLRQQEAMRNQLTVLIFTL